jgi:C4-dicarboxylate transporter/malic acid transport protein
MSTEDFMRELEHPGDAFANIGPNWFAVVMGTGILATAAALLPVDSPVLRDFAVGPWFLAVALLVVIAAATAIHWLRHPERARAHAADPAMAPFYGTVPMAILTVGAGTLLVGREVVGLDAAVLADSILWGLGTLIGLFVSVAIPTLMITRHRLDPRRTLATWLLPVVPPMVSAAGGAALISHLPSEGARRAMLVACLAMFGLSLMFSLLTIALVWFRLIFFEPTPPALVPTLWIVLGPLGQSITAANGLGNAASTALPAPFATGARVFGFLYGVPVWGFAMMWLALVVTTTLHTARTVSMPFSLTWWSFTFPVGTCVTGTSLLAAATGSDLLRWAALLLYVLLLAGWITAAVHTTRAAFRGTVFAPMPLPTPVS